MPPSSPDSAGVDVDALGLFPGHSADAEAARPTDAEAARP
jgi:hypothetical protein